MNPLVVDAIDTGLTAALIDYFYSRLPGGEFLPSDIEIKRLFIIFIGTAFGYILLKQLK